jgi:hypothetical protein
MKGNVAKRQSPMAKLTLAVVCWISDIGQRLKIDAVADI